MKEGRRDLVQLYAHCLIHVYQAWMGQIVYNRLHIILARESAFWHEQTT